MKYLDPEWQIRLENLSEQENTRTTHLLMHLAFAPKPSQRVIDAINGEPMTTTAPRIKAGGLPPTHLHRVDASLLKDDYVVEQFGEMPIQYAEPDDEDGPEEMLAFLIVLVIFIGLLAIWWSV